MPVHNGEAFLGSAIDSILRQTYADFEFIIINDGSTDSTEEIVKSRTDARIRYLQNGKNMGIANCLNQCLSLAQGEYLARMDADDISLPHRIERQLACLDDNPKIGVLGSASQIIDGQGNLSHIVRFPCENGLLKWRLSFENPIVHSTVMMRRVVVQEAGGYNPEMLCSQDYDLWWRLRGMTAFSNLQDVMLYLRKHEKTITNIRSFEQRRTGIEIARRGLSKLLSEDVCSEHVERLWSQQFQTTEQILRVARLIYLSAMTIGAEDDIRGYEKRQIRKDASERLLLLIRPQLENITKRRLLGYIWGLDPSCFIRAIARFTDTKGKLIWKTIFRGVSRGLTRRRSKVIGDSEEGAPSCTVGNALVETGQGDGQAFYEQFVSNGALCFDVGANIGNRTDILLELGAKVVCVEPQPTCVDTLEKKYQGNPSVVVVAKGLASKVGSMPLSVCEQANTISTFSEKWKTGRFHHYSWDTTLDVPMTTLDALIEEFGMPDFCKIDVEGFEYQVLQGLSSPVKVLCFEFTKEFVDDGGLCMQYLSSIGRVQFNYTLGENMSLALPQWTDSKAILHSLHQIGDDLLWGDIYARFW